MPRSLFRLVIAVAVIVATGVLVLSFDHELAPHFKPPWMSECERLEHRCAAASKSGTDIGGALVCAGAGLANLIKEGEDNCKKANETLDARKK
jgi:hypothetical protein